MSNAQPTGTRCRDIDGFRFRSTHPTRFIVRLVGYPPNGRNIALFNGCTAKWNKALVAGDELEIVKRAGKAQS